MKCNNTAGIQNHVTLLRIVITRNLRDSTLGFLTHVIRFLKSIALSPDMEGNNGRHCTTIYLDSKGSKPGPHVAHVGDPQQHDIDDVPSATLSTNVNNVITTQALRLL